MSNRYGRRQRRAHRERIAELERDLAKAERVIETNRQRALSAESRALSAERRAFNVQAEAFQSFMAASGLMKVYVETIGAELGRALAPEVQRIADQILNAQGAARSRPRIELTVPWAEQSMRRLHGTIGPIAYDIAFSEREMRDTLMGVEFTSR